MKGNNMSGFISMRDLLRGSQDPDKIWYKYYAHTKRLYFQVVLFIPRKITAQAGIDIGTKVNVLYDPDQKLIKIVLLKQNEKGLGVHKGDTLNPPHKVKICFTYKEESGLPKKHVIVENYTIQSGLIFSLDEE
jgi:hypothetical protein